MNNANSTQVSRAVFWRKIVIVSSIALVAVIFLKPALFQYYEALYVAELIQ